MLEMVTSKLTEDWLPLIKVLQFWSNILPYDNIDWTSSVRILQVSEDEWNQFFIYCCFEKET